MIALCDIRNRLPLGWFDALTRSEQELAIYEWHTQGRTPQAVREAYPEVPEDRLQAIRLVLCQLWLDIPRHLQQLQAASRYVQALTDEAERKFGEELIMAIEDPEQSTQYYTGSAKEWRLRWRLKVNIERAQIISQEIRALLCTH